jgi:hypothetical protein
LALRCCKAADCGSSSGGTLAPPTSVAMRAAFAPPAAVRPAKVMGPPATDLVVADRRPRKEVPWFVAFLRRRQAAGLS